MYEFIGQNIRKHREKQGLSREKLTELSGVSSNHIGLIERSAKMPRVDTLHRLCEGLNISLFDVVYGRKNDNKDINFHKIISLLNEMNANELESAYVIIRELKNQKNN